MTLREEIRRHYPFVILSFLALFGFYHSVLRDLFVDYWNDPNYSHGFLIPIVTAYLIWQMRESLGKLEPTGIRFGWLLSCAASLLTVYGATTGVEFALRVSFLLWFYGAVIVLFGLPAWRAVLFPMALLLFMLPLPYIVYDQIAFPLKLLASNVATSILTLVGIPVFREGNIITLPTMVLEVADACSGIRSLVSLLFIATLVVYMANRKWYVRTVVVLLAIPIAVVSNAFRVFGTGVLVGIGYQKAAEGFFHTFSGWLVFVIGVLMIFSLSKLGTWLERSLGRE